MKSFTLFLHCYFAIEYWLSFLLFLHIHIIIILNLHLFLIQKNRFPFLHLLHRVNLNLLWFYFWDLLYLKIFIWIWVFFHFDLGDSGIIFCHFLGSTFFGNAAFIRIIFDIFIIADSIFQESVSKIWSFPAFLFRVSSWRGL